MTYLWHYETTAALEWLGFANCSECRKYLTRSTPLHYKMLKVLHLLISALKVCLSKRWLHGEGICFRIWHQSLVFSTGTDWTLLVQVVPSIWLTTVDWLVPQVLSNHAQNQSSHNHSINIQVPLQDVSSYVQVVQITGMPLPGLVLAAAEEFPVQHFAHVPLLKRFFRLHEYDHAGVRAMVLVFTDPNICIKHFERKGE